MDDINSRVKSNSDSRAENNNNSQAETVIDSRAETNKPARVENKLTPPLKVGRPRIYVDKSEAMKAYRTRVRKLQAEASDTLDTLTTAVLSDLLAKSLRTLASNVATPEKVEATEARKQAGRIIKVLRARYTIRLG